MFLEIQKFRDQGYSWNEMCILTRKKDQGIKVSSFLMEQGIPIVSGESLLLKSSKEVEMLINLLRVAINPNNKQAKFEALSYLSDGLESHADKHHFVLDGLETDGSGLENLLQENGFNLPWVAMSELPLFEFFQACISGLQLALTSDAFTIEFMEMVWAFSIRPPNGKMDFLDHWENGKEKFSLNSSVGSDAVQIMTIHKSKGLEFPIVIFPWADMKIEDYRDHKIWVPNPLPCESIDQILIKFNKGIKEYSEEIAEIYDQEIAKAQLDNLNLVYVALTRAIDQLSIITEDHGPMKDRPSYTGEYFRDYLVSQDMWEDHKQWFQIGQAARESIPSVKTSVPEADIKVPSGGLLFDRIHLASGRAKLWNTETEASIRWGNLVHDTLSRIETQADLNLALDFAEQEYKLDRQEINILKDHILRVIHHDELVHFFDGGDEILNEREIYTAAGHSLRPDRVNIHKEKYVSIIDYKTGSPDKNHRDQVREYGKALEEIGFKVRERIVIYTNSEGVLINKE
ncbi:3'-5' exonuclease [Aureitalea marina]|uniref:UvrD-like helicase C-terminal domain-containing protein n=1 Tax=Aureitalea marina TaxID=930804 RepID=A0A2S7KRV7_9FLAO|nr:3'-5' exonuclease [Aureitalea marina]PQB05364.1 hypothetical protein BST85_11050 [Aureitalea marina]